MFFGIAEIFEKEAGYFLLSDLTNIKLPFGLTIERDIYHTPMTKEEIEAYVATGESDDKAGSYGIQGLGGLFVKGICGDYQTVVGMPLAMLYEILKNEFSFDMLNQSSVKEGV